jgi:hypothetical protein
VSPVQEDPDHARDDEDGLRRLRHHRRRDSIHRCALRNVGIHSWNNFRLIYLRASVVHMFAQAHGLGNYSATRKQLAMGTTFIPIADIGAHQQYSLEVSPGILSKRYKALDLARMTKLWHTSDPRDSVFVLRGLHPSFAKMEANYSATVEEIFEAATLALLANATWSQLYWSQPSQSPYLPFWVVDFSTNAIHADMKSNGVQLHLLHYGKLMPLPVHL